MHLCVCVFVCVCVCVCNIVELNDRTDLFKNYKLIGIAHR